MGVLYLRNVSWAFSFKEIKEYKTVIKLTELQKQNTLLKHFILRGPAAFLLGKGDLENQGVTRLQILLSC